MPNSAALQWPMMSSAERMMFTIHIIKRHNWPQGSAQLYTWSDCVMPTVAFRPTRPYVLGQFHTIKFKRLFTAQHRRS